MVGACLALPAGGAAAQRVVDLGATDRPVDVVVAPVYRLGGAAATGADAFERLSAVAFDDAGRLYVLDSGTSRISVFDAQGRFQRAMGQEGDGPGEFKRTWTFAVRGDGTVVATDVLPDEFVVFGPDGAHVRTWVTEAEEGELGRPFSLAGADHVAVAAQLFISSGVPRLGGEEGPAADRPILLFPLDGGPGRVVHRAWVAHPAARGVAAETSRAFDAETHVLGLRDGRVAVADTTTFRIRVVDPATGAVTTLRRSLEPLPVTEEHRAVAIQQRIDDIEAGRVNVMMMGGRQSSRSEVNMRLKEEARRMGFPSQFQHIRGLREDPAGRLWIQRAAPDPEAAGAVDIVTTERYLGTVRTPGFRLPDAFGPGGLVAWIEEDDMEAAVVRVARLPVGLR